MRKKTLIASALVTALSLPAGFALAANQEPVRERAQAQKQEQVYGSQLMTEQERAKERGVTLPDEPPARGIRMRSGGGMGSGEGRGR